MTESKILGVTFHSMSEAEAVSKFMSRLDEPSGCKPDACKTVVTPNPEAVMRARKDASYAAALNGADFRLADGTGIVLASRLTRSPIPCRLRGYDTVIKLFEAIKSSRRKTTAYFLGCQPGVAEEAARNMENAYPPLKIIGCRDGYFKPESENSVAEEIKRLRPDILVIGMGMPRQELFAHAHKDLPVKLAFCLGGSLDVMAGNVKLAPEGFRRLGLEWLYRLIKQPERAKRMLELPKFAALVLWRFVMPFAKVEE